MTSEVIHSRLEAVFRDVFDDDTITLTRLTHAGDIPDWDSLAQINLVVAIEKDFGIALSLDDMSRLLNVGDMLDLIQNKVTA